MLSPKFIKEGTDRSEAKKMECYTALGKVDFAYYDDEGYLCGVSIIYSPHDPSLWTADIIRNTPGKSEDRDVLFISSEELVDPEQGESIDGTAATEDFLKFLKSKTITELFKGTILPDGRVEVSKLQALTKTVEQEKAPIALTLYNETLAARQALFTRLTHEHYDPAISLIDEEFQPVIAGKKEDLKKINKKYQDLIQEKREEIKRINEQFQADVAQLDNTSALQKATRQLYTRRNAGSIAFGVIAFITLVNLILIATGFLASFGIALETGLATYLGLGGAAAGTAAAVANVTNNEKQLAKFRGEIIALNNIRLGMIEPIEKEIEALNSARQEELALIQAELDELYAPADKEFEGVCRAAFREADLEDERKRLEEEARLREESDFDEVASGLREVVSDFSAYGHASDLVGSVSAKPTEPVKSEKEVIVKEERLQPDSIRSAMS